MQYAARMMKTFIQMLYLIHIIACAYYKISDYEGLNSNNFVYDGNGTSYIRCFYFATKTATSIGKLKKTLPLGVKLTFSRKKSETNQYHRDGQGSDPAHRGTDGSSMSPAPRTLPL